MKTKINFLIVSVLLITSNAIGQKTKSDLKVEVKKMDKIQLIYYDFTGPYDQSFNEFGQLMGYLQANKIKMGKYSLGIFYDDPVEVPAEELKSKIGFMVQEEVKSDEKYKYKEIPAGKAVTVKYTSIDEIMPAYEAISDYITKNDLKTVDYSVELYYSSDPQVIDAEILFYIK